MGHRLDIHSLSSNVGPFVGMRVLFFVMKKNLNVTDRGTTNVNIIHENTFIQIDYIDFSNHLAFKIIPAVS